MPLAALKTGKQVEDWLLSVNSVLRKPGSLILIGSGGLLWHAFQKGLEVELPDNSMDIDPITESEEVAWLCHDAHIGSEIEKSMGFHINLMPRRALEGLPAGWEARATTKEYGQLTVQVPSADDLLVPKVSRGEKRDLAQARWAFLNSICERSHTPLAPQDGLSVPEGRPIP
jgi:hypothetical protein